MTYSFTFANTNNLPMRIKLKLSFIGANRTLPLNSNYFQTALIYHIINSSSSEYSAFLHDQGYAFEGHKQFKFFTYSQFIVPQKRIEGENLICLSREIYWQISSPIAEFVQHLVLGLYEHNEVNLQEARLRMETVEAVPEPAFTPAMKFSLLSPMVVSTVRENATTAYYIRPEESQAFSEGVRKNLLGKYQTLFGKLPENDDLELRFDQDYINKKNGKISRLIRIKETQIKGVMAPFAVRGSQELIQLGYECGFGEKNSMGFGMARVPGHRDDSAASTL
jgi:CRISPR-associated endoribonuclease Cas6